MTQLPLEDILFATENLCELLEIENDALLRHDADTVRELSANKSALARLYEQSVLPMADDPSLVDALEPDEREILIEMGTRLKGLVEENALLLKAEMEARQKVMDAMVNAVRVISANTVTYGATGSFEGTAGKGPEVNSLSFNETL